jgi:hypothetical protein
MAAIAIVMQVISLGVERCRVLGAVTMDHSFLVTEPLTGSCEDLVARRADVVFKSQVACE